MSMKTLGKNHTTTIAVIGSLLLAVILVTGTVLTGQQARRDTADAVRAVSLLYMDELAGRRGQVVENNLADRIRDIEAAVGLMDNGDLSSKQRLEEYQARMKQLFRLERFAFVDTEGIIYTSTGTQDNISSFAFDYRTLTGPHISILDAGHEGRKVIVALPVSRRFLDKSLCVCFMQISMAEMLSGVSMNTNTGEATFCNLYTGKGQALTDAVLGGLAREDNLLSAMRSATFDAPDTYESFAEAFSRGERGIVSFTYNGIHETMAFIPVSGTDWQLTYLIRESVITDRISSISNGTIVRSILQSALTIAVMALMFGFILGQTKRSAQLELERETSEAAARVKQQELEQRLSLQEKLLEEERLREQQFSMITALSADYWSVYYLDLDTDSGICYQAHNDLDGTGFRVGDHFRYLSSVTAYAGQYVTEDCREEFLRFIQPDQIRQGLSDRRVISLTYTVLRHGRKSYETVRFASVHRPGEEGNYSSIGACFVDSDLETRQAMAQQHALSDALAAAEAANRAKTAFLSNMSHEIRTPMNAIIGLDSIALSDPDTPEKTKEYLRKIGGSADHLLSLINDILDMTRIESGRMTLKNEEFSFARLLETINTMFSGQCRDKGLKYHCHIRGEVDEYYIGDSTKLRQVLINILGNAVKFTPEGGSVEMNVQRTARYENKSTLQFTIADTGIGMSKEFIPHIFDAFAQEDSSATNKYGSSGLGLAITRSIVGMMNGSIDVKSKKGEGSTFTVTVTLTDRADEDGQRPEREIDPEKLNVLVVDDDPVALEHARLVLEKAGIASETADSGEKAVDMVRIRQARREPYDLILLDWQMPRMDGLMTARQIRGLTGGGSAIIILTAYRFDDILDEARQAGVDSCISKPLFAASLLEEFRSALSRRKLPADKKSPAASLEGRRILLAEDMQVNAEIMEMVLAMRKINTDLAENGRIAVDKFAAHEPGYYSAILMDMRMPEMDGLEATRLIRAMDRPDAARIPIIALTANAFDEDVQRSLQAGLNAHLSKPVQPEALFEALESLIGQMEADREEGKTPPAIT